MINYTIAKHATANVSKLLATTGGAHIYNVTLSTAADNGNIIKRGAWLSFDNYAEAAATEIDAVVRGQAANGNWYVEVVDPKDCLLVYNPPVIEEDYNNRFKAEYNFFVGEGEVARAHELMKGDLFEVSAEGFSKTPSAGKTISTIASKKLVIA